MKQQQLDEDGLASSYLLLTALLPLCVYLLYSLLKPRPSFSCACTACAARKPKRNIPLAGAALLVCLVVSYLIKNILTIKIGKKSADFDPFQILNVTPDSSQSEVKKNYMKMLKGFNRKLNKKEFKAAAEEGMKNLNKAFTILKDPESLNNWISNGPSKELLIAIPSSILRFRSSLLMLYIVVIAVAVPSFFLLKHLAFKKVSFSGSKYTSNAMFYDEIGGFSEVPLLILHQCIFVAGKADEFKERVWNKPLPEDTTRIVEMEHGVPVMGETDGYLRILMYLARRIEDPEDREYIRSKTLMLIEAYKRIAYFMKSTRVFESLLILEKMVHQAILDPDFYQLQYPGINYGHLQLGSGQQARKSLESDEQLITH